MRLGFAKYRSSALVFLLSRRVCQRGRQLIKAGWKNLSRKHCMEAVFGKLHPSQPA